MSKPKAKTFAELVREVEQEPVAPPPPDYSAVHDPTGQRWRQDQAEISAAVALDLAREGARVAWDRCGCGGYCGFDWYSTEDVARLVAAGTPNVRHTKRRQGNISLWKSDSGDLLVLAEDAVRWGDLIDG